MRQQPDNAAAYATLGRAFIANGQDTEAAEAFRKATELNPGLLTPNERLAQIALRQGKAAAVVSGARTAPSRGQ